MCGIELSNGGRCWASKTYDDNAYRVLLCYPFNRYVADTWMSR